MAKRSHRPSQRARQSLGQVAGQAGSSTTVSSLRDLKSMVQTGDRRHHEIDGDSNAMWNCSGGVVQANQQCDRRFLRRTVRAQADPAVHTVASSGSIRAVRRQNLINNLYNNYKQQTRHLPARAMKGEPTIDDLSTPAQAPWKFISRLSEIAVTGGCAISPAGSPHAFCWPAHYPATLRSPRKPIAASSCWYFAQRDDLIQIASAQKVFDLAR